MSRFVACCRCASGGRARSTLLTCVQCRESGDRVTTPRMVRSQASCAGACRCITLTRAAIGRTAAMGIFRRLCMRMPGPEPGPSFRTPAGRAVGHAGAPRPQLISHGTCSRYPGGTPDRGRAGNDHIIPCTESGIWSGRPELVPSRSTGISYECSPGVMPEAVTGVRRERGQGPVQGVRQSPGRGYVLIQLAAEHTETDLGSTRWVREQGLLRVPDHEAFPAGIARGGRNHSRHQHPEAQGPAPDATLHWHLSPNMPR